MNKQIITKMTEVVPEPMLSKPDETPIKQICSSEEVRQSEQNETTSNNQDKSKPHKKRRRKHKKVKVHRDPEQIKEIRLQRFNLKRQGQWNNRFINDTIPEMYLSKAKHKKRSEQPVRRNKSPIQTVYLDKDVAKNKLPQLTAKHPQENKHTQKSFNIRTVTGKKEGFPVKHRKGGKRTLQEKLERRSIQQKDLSAKLQQLHTDKALNKPKQSTYDKLKSKLSEQTKLHPINPSYNALLTDLIEHFAPNSGSKPTKQLKMLLQNEINSIGSNKNSYVRIDAMVRERKKMLKNIEEKGEAKVTLGDLLSFQLTSVVMIEEILKFKAKWEEQYYKMGQRNKKVEYNYQGQNYLLSLSEEVRQLCPEGPLDPFLISMTHKLQQESTVPLKEEQISERKEMLLKIRACELLLIEESLNDGI